MLRRFVALSFSVLMLSFGLQAQGHGNGKNKQGEADNRGAAVSVQGSIVFSHRDRDIIRSYYNGRNSNLPPGLAKRGGNLPPGLQKHLERDGTLPPGLQKRAEAFPPELDRRLPQLPDVYRRCWIDGSVVIVDRRTQRIMDVVYDILRP